MTFVKIKGPVGPPGWHPGLPYGTPNPAPPPWQQPPIPEGAYDPTRGIELARGKTQTKNLLEDLGTSELRGADNYTLATQAVGRRQQIEAENHANALKQLDESYKRLGVRQNEAANGAGLLNGGALLQAAAKRAANEAKAQEPINTNYGRQQQADTVDLAQLALNRQREAQGHVTTGTRAEEAQDQFALDTQKLEEIEAAKNGYISPLPPHAPTPAAPHPLVIGSRAQPNSLAQRDYLAAAKRRGRGL